MRGLGRILLVLAGVALLATPARAQGWSAPPAGAAPNQWIPARDKRGNYITPNTRLSRDETSWHVRAALNVAALGCRDAAEAERVGAYNRLLRRQRRAFAATDRRVKRAYRARHGPSWKTEHDRQMTRVYNFFSQPIAHDGFCAVARDVLVRANAVKPGRFGRFAAQALPRLKAPFTSFYRRYDAYRLSISGGGPAPRRR